MAQDTETSRPGGAGLIFGMSMLILIVLVAAYVFLNRSGNPSPRPTLAPAPTAVSPGNTPPPADSSGSIS